MHNVSIYFTAAISLALGAWLGWTIAKKPSPEKKTGQNDRDAYIRGLKYIISNQPDKAIAEFTRAVQVDSNTIEIYQDLGNLFRERGEVGRATQIHQSILLRPSLDREFRISALMNLGLDYQKGGFIDRAIKVYQEVLEHDEDNLQAYRLLEELYEEGKDWENAYQMEKQIQKLAGASSNYSRIAHLMTEMGKVAYQKNDYTQAIKKLKEAISLDKDCTEAYLILGDIYLAEDKPAKAIAIFNKIISSDQYQHSFGVHKLLEKAYLQKGRFESIESVYQEILTRRPQDTRTRAILADYYYKKGLIPRAIEELQEGLKVCPESLTLRSTLAEMLIRDNRQDEALREYQHLIEQIMDKNEVFSCQKCGYQSSQIQWKCPQCKEWDSYVAHQI
ncbi:MAG: tetratricopeptide repeat protein [bacterium]